MTERLPLDRQGEWHEDARRLAAEGHSTSEIAAMVGKTKSAVWKALNPERIRELRQVDNRARRPIKREWDRTDQARVGRSRRDHEVYRKSCADCGALMGAGSRHAEGERCRTCEYKRRAERHEALLAQIETMWNERGMTGEQIATALGRSAGARSVSRDLQELRRAGRLISRRKGVVARA